MTQQPCPSCGYANLVGEIFCVECGYLLVEMEGWEQRRMTQSLPIEQQEAIAAADQARQGTKTFSDELRLALHMGEGQREVVAVPDQGEVTIGRVDQFTSVLPTINLTNYNAWERGVSRVHVAIRRDGVNLYLVDLESTNGTFLNGQRVWANNPRLLHHGDRIRLGLFEIDVTFIPATEAV